MIMATKTTRRPIRTSASRLIPQKIAGPARVRDAADCIPAPHGIWDELQTTVVESPADERLRAIVGEVLKVPLPAIPQFMEKAWNAYTDSCVCGTRYADNCSHYLTNAFALAGATFPKNTAKCPKGRMIRAKETLAWFRPMAKKFRKDHSAITSGIWFVYQERADGQAHVCLHRESPQRYWYRGTGDFPDWKVQWHFLY
jgi:hypothetical protein